METTDKRYCHLPCHCKCDTAARAIKNKAKSGGDKKQTTALKQMRAEDPKNYSGFTTLLVSYEKGKRDNCKRIEVLLV